MPRTLLPESQIHPGVREKIANYRSDTVKEVQAAVAANAIVVVGMRMNPFPKKARNALDAAGLAYEYLEYGSYLSEWRRRLALKMWTSCSKPRARRPRPISPPRIRAARRRPGGRTRSPTPPWFNRWRDTAASRARGAIRKDAGPPNAARWWSGSRERMPKSWGGRSGRTRSCSWRRAARPSWWSSGLERAFPAAPCPRHQRLARLAGPRRSLDHRYQ